MADRPSRRGRIRAPCRIRRPRGGTHDVTQLPRRAADRSQRAPTLPDDLAHRSRADRGQLPAQVLGDREEERLDHLGRAAELGAQVVALRGDPGRARVEVALAGHVAADRDQRRRAERELLGTEQRGDQQVATGLQATIGAQRDAVAQVVAEQDLVDLGQTELPRRADVLDRGQRRGARPAGVPGQVDVRRAGLGHTGGDRPDATPTRRASPRSGRPG